MKNNKEELDKLLMDFEEETKKSSPLQESKKVQGKWKPDDSAEKIVVAESPVKLTKPPVEKKQIPRIPLKKEKKTIDGVELEIKKVKQQEEEQVQPREKVRTYSNNAEMDKIIFRPPKKETPFYFKLIMFACVCVAVGVFLGLQSSSYYNYAISRNIGIESIASCAWLWLLTTDMSFSPTPLNSDSFMVGFFIGFSLLAVIGIFSYLDKDARKQSRVGREHGQARICTPRDFKQFKNKFMEK